jgi:glutamyl-tRNA reductase
MAGAVPLVIVNREPGTQPVAPGAPVWRTCLREVVFAGDVTDAPPLHDGARPLVEGDAYRLLLEILCGLQSPMLGETQVMGQFKTFLSSLDRQQGWLNTLGQRLLADARDIRTSHLQGLGSRSYGSAVRRYLSEMTHTVLIGTGKLAQEVLPFLADAGRSVDQWGRTTDVSEFPAPRSASVFHYRLYDSADTFAGPAVPTALVIAAPVPSPIVDRVAACYPSLACAIDLRGELDTAPLHVDAPVITLHDLFAQMRATHGTAARLVDAARSEILSRSRRYELRDELRPFGWDDLCA